MATLSDKTLLIQTMRTLLDELSAPDLTAPRAAVLRSELTRVMDAVRGAESATAPERVWSNANGAHTKPNHPCSDLIPFPTPLSLRSVG